MAPNSLYPAYVLLQYHSAFGTHFMTLPTNAWNDEPVAGGAGTFDSWTSGSRDADAMINDLVDLFVPFFKADTSFDLYSIFTLENAEATPRPRATKQLTQVGTNATTTWSKAVETTFMFRTDLFGIRRLTFLDAPSGGVFDKISTFDTSPEAIAIRDELADESNAWSARDNGRPVVLTQITYTLNEKLRKEYGMT
jgi:hypothetical protein